MSSKKSEQDDTGPDSKTGMGVKPPAGEHESTVRQSILEKNERRVKDAAWEKKLAEQHTDLTNKFMSREDQLFFRGLTRVLQLTDILEARKAGDDLDLRNKTLNKTTPLYKIANRIVLNPTPREYDIAALTMGGYVEDASSIDFGNVQQPRLILTSNPESKDHLKLGRKPDEEEYPLRLLEKYAVDATDTKRYAGGIHEEAGKDIVTFVLGTFIECKILQSKQVPYPRHVGYYMELLKDCHKASSSEQLSIAGERSTDYVILTSYGKTLRRLNFGIGHRPQQRYLFDIITMPIEKLPERAHAIPCPSLENPSQEPNQRKMLQQCFAKISNYPAASRDALATQPVYDRKGRKRFHYMLAFRVIKLRTNLSDVREAIQAYVKAEYDHPAKVAKDRKKPKLLRDELRLLACLQTYFKDIVPAHMLWLAQVTGATNAKDFPLWSDNEPSTSSESQAPAKSSSPLPSLSIITSAGPTTAEEDQSLQKATVVAGDADNADDEDEELEKQGDPTLNRPGEGAFALWMRQASKWLSLVSQHDIGLLNAIPSSFEKRSERSLQMSKQIVAAEVVVVQLGTQDPDDKKMSINNCLEELGTRMTKAGNLGLDISKLKEIIKVQNGNRIRYEEKLMVAETFHIVPHADATAIALMACFEDHDSFMSDEYSQTATLAAPGHHNVWSQVSLPPSTPKALAQGVLDYALKQVYDKLMRLRSRAITHEVFKQDSSQEFAARLEADPKIPDEPEYEEESSESAISILVSSPPNKPTPIPPGTMDRPTPEVSSARPFSGLDPQAAEFSPTPTARR